MEHMNVSEYLLSLNVDVNEHLMQDEKENVFLKRENSNKNIENRFLVPAFIL